MHKGGEAGEETKSYVSLYSEMLLENLAKQNHIPSLGRSVWWQGRGLGEREPEGWKALSW
jgi:hypothetical protein